MPKYPPPIIETARLLLTWPTPEQIDGYYNAIIGTSIFDTIFWDGPTDDQEMHAFWKQSKLRDPSDFGLSLDIAMLGYPEVCAYSRWIQILKVQPCVQESLVGAEDPDPSRTSAHTHFLAFLILRLFEFTNPCG